MSTTLVRFINTAYMVRSDGAEGSANITSSIIRRDFKDARSVIF